MKRNGFGHILLLVLSFVTLSFGSAHGSSTATGTLNVTVNMVYDEGQMEWWNAYSSLETWTIAQIMTQKPEFSFRESDQKSVYDYVAGFTPVPPPLSVSYSGTYTSGSANIVNDATAGPFQPSGQSITQAETSGNQEDIYVYSNMIYIAGLRALQDGTFSFHVNYDGNWAGQLGGVNDFGILCGSIQYSLERILFDESGRISGGVYEESGMEERRLNLTDYQQVVIDDFSGTVGFAYDFEAGDVFYLRLDNLNFLYLDPTNTPSPVPAPATMLLLGSGLACLAGLRRCFWRG
jgi:hypothetical protein